MLNSFIFDLDGVVVDTAKYHYLAWKRLAEQFGYNFTEKENEQFKGVNRITCMKILSELMGKMLSDDECLKLADLKNEWYVEYISGMGKDELLPGFLDFILTLRKRGYKTALASASKNTGIVLERLEISNCFDAIVDGNDVLRSKPDPQVFQLAAQKLESNPEDCIVFEDAQAGIDAAKTANMFAVGICSDESTLNGADALIPGFKSTKVDDIINLFNNIKKTA